MKSFNSPQIIFFHYFHHYRTIFISCYDMPNCSFTLTFDHTQREIVSTFDPLLLDFSNQVSNPPHYFSSNILTKPYVLKKNRTRAKEMCCRYYKLLLRVIYPNFKIRVKLAKIKWGLLFTVLLVVECVLFVW